MAFLKRNHASAAHWAFSLTLAVAIHLAALTIKFNAASGAGRCAGSPGSTLVVIAALEALPAELDSGRSVPARYHPRQELMTDAAALLAPSANPPPHAAASRCSLPSRHILPALAARPFPETQRPVHIVAAPDTALDAGPLAAGGGPGSGSGSGRAGGISGSADGQDSAGSGIGVGSGDGSGDGTGSGRSGSGKGLGMGGGGTGTGFGAAANATSPQTSVQQLHLAGKPVYPRACRQGLCRHGPPCEGCSEWRIHVSPEGGKPLKIECLKRMECELQNASIRKFFAEAGFPRTGRAIVYVIPVRMFTRKE